MSGRRWRSARERDIENQADAAFPPEQTSSHRRVYATNRGRSHDLVLFDRQESTDIQVGTRNDAKTFHVNKNLICNFSAYFTEVFLSNKSNGVDLVEDDPVVFDMFIKWIISAESPISYNPDEYSEEPWLSNAVAAWVLAKKLLATEFEAYSLSQFIQNCALAAFGPWEYIETIAPPGSSIRRFSDHWVAWNCHLAGLGRNEFSDLEGRWRAALVTEETRDPRIFDIEHWYSSCGNDINPSCTHDPIARQANLEQSSHRPESPLEWGRSLEIQRESLLHGRRSSSSSSSLQNPYAPPVYTVRPTGTYHSPPRPFAPVQPSYTYTRPPPRPVYQTPIVQPYSSSNVQPRTTYRTHNDSHCLKRSVKALIAFIFVAQSAVIIALCVSMLFNPENGIRYTTRTYSLFVASLCGLTVFAPWVFPAYIVFGIGSGIATVLDMMSCRSSVSSIDYGYYYYGAPNPPQSCQKIMILTILIWSSLPTSAAYFYIWPYKWRHCDCC